MKKIIISLGLIFTVVQVMAQETRVEKTNSTTQEEDSKENSDDVPDAYGIIGEFDEILVARFKYKADLLVGLDSIVKKHNIKNAVILSGIGSVRGYHIHQVNNRTFPSKNIYVKDPTAPADLISTNGYIINGKVHAHITLANPDKSFGGHLEYGTEVFTFAILTIGVLNDEADLELVDKKHYR
jgi:predicted DNA-binding protein with PD1-like motif